MGVIWAGTEMGHFEISGATIATDAASRREGWTRHAILIDNHSSDYFARAVLPASLTDFYFSVQVRVDSTSTNRSFVYFKNGDNTAFSLIRNSNDTLEVRNSGGSVVWSQAEAMPTDLVRLVIHVTDLDNSPNQKIQIWINDQEVINETGSFSAESSINRIQFMSQRGSPTGDHRTMLSEVIVADEPVHGWGVRSVWPTSDGTPFEWSGSYENVNDAVPDEDTLINSDTAGQEAVMGGPDMPTTDLVPKAVFAHAIAQATGSNPSDLELGVKTPNGDRHYGNPQTLTSAFERYTEKFENNPQTSQPWTRAELNDTDMAVRSQD